MEKLANNSPVRFWISMVSLLSAGFIALMMVLVLMPGTASAAPSDDKQAEADAAKEQLDELQVQLDIASNNYYAALAEQEAAQAGMDEASARIDEIDGELEGLQAQLSERVSEMYLHGSITFTDILVGSSSFRDLVTNWDMLVQMNERDSALVDQTKALKTEAEQQRAEYAEQETLAAAKAAEAATVKAEAETLVADMQATYDELSAEAAELLEQEQLAATLAAGYSGGSYSGSEPAYNPVTGNAVVDRAYSYVGNANYVWGACSPGNFDCSGFVSYCLSGAYSRLGTTWTFLTWPQTNDPQPGDVCTNEGHCGIYIGNGQMIHCATYGVGVIIGPVQAGMTYHRYC